MKSIHEDLVCRVEKELQTRGYIDICKLTEYKSCGVCGEIDIYTTKDKYVLLFEVKSNRTPKAYNKAIKQLERAEKYHFKNYKQRIFKFLVYRKNDEVVYEWIKHKPVI